MQPTEPVQPERSKKSGASPAMGILIIILLVPAIYFGYGFLQGTTTPAAADPSQNPEYSSEFYASAIGADSPESPPGASYPHIVYEEGTLYVRGVASNEGLVGQTVAELEALFGEGNVVPEVVIEPSHIDDVNAATSVYFSEMVLFSPGSSVVAPEFQEVLGASASFLQLSPETTLLITGHTDSDGSEESNLELSQARVDAAREAMIAQGGDPERITAVGAGESEPIADNTTPEGRQLNRRVELTIESS